MISPRLELEPAVIVGHIGSLATIAGALNGALPAVATLFAILFYIVQIWESKTVQAWRMGRQSTVKIQSDAAMDKVTSAQAELGHAAEHIAAAAAATDADNSG